VLALRKRGGAEITVHVANYEGRENTAVLRLEDAEGRAVEPRQYKLYLTDPEHEEAESGPFALEPRSQILMLTLSPYSLISVSVALAGRTGITLDCGP